MSREPLLPMEPVTIETASKEARPLLESANSRMGFVPNMYGYMAKLSPVLAGYMSTYDAFRTQSGFAPAEQEAVLLTVSRINGCTYCTAAHSMIADKKSGVPADALRALREGSAVPDPKLAAVASFTEAMVTSRGNPGKEAVDAFIAAGYNEQQILGVVLAIACKTISNSVNHLAGTPVDEVFRPYLPE